MAQIVQHYATKLPVRVGIQLVVTFVECFTMVLSEVFRKHRALHGNPPRCVFESGPYLCFMDTFLQVVVSCVTITENKQLNLISDEVKQKIH